MCTPANQNVVFVLVANQNVVLNLSHPITMLTRNAGTRYIPTPKQTTHHSHVAGAAVTFAVTHH